MGLIPAAQTAVGLIPAAQSAVGLIPAAQTAVGLIPAAQSAVGQSPQLIRSRNVKEFTGQNDTREKHTRITSGIYKTQIGFAQTDLQKAKLSERMPFGTMVISWSS